MKLCAERGIEQRFTQVRNPKTNGKAERVIKMILNPWHDKTRIASLEN
jgi:transposase InsO family protein